MALARISSYVFLLAAILPVRAQLNLSNATALLDSETRQGHVGAASILVAYQGKVVLHRGFGSAGPDSIYLVASITKPVTATALMLLVERGLVSLHDPVKVYLPEFKGGDRDKVLVRDLLSHTSGLPDMLPENTELRRAHAPLSEFVKRTYTTPLIYTPGTSFRYQSMGILLAGAIVEKFTGMPLREFEQREIFGPLGMQHTVLGLGNLKIAETVLTSAGAHENSKDNESFGADSPYWRDMGHPWGGMHSTVSDLGILLQMFLNGGLTGGKRVLSPATVRAMTTDQNTKVGAPWGLGWAMGRAIAWNGFGDLVSPRAFGHSGATGTVAWADPDTQLICVIFTNRSWGADDGSLLRRVSNAVAASLPK